MVWKLGIEPPSPHHIIKCLNCSCTMLQNEANGRQDWRYDLNQKAKLKYPNMPDSFTGSQIFAIPEFKDYYNSLPNLTEDTSASSNTNRSDHI